MDQQEIQISNFKFPPTHLFVYKDKKYPFNYDIFKFFSKTVLQMESIFSNSKEIDLLLNKNENHIVLSDETITNFIQFCQMGKCVINKENVIHLNYLSQMYEVGDLISATNNFISNHQKDLQVEMLSFLQNSPNQTAEIEENISNNLFDYLKEEKFFSLSIPVLHRIFSIFSEKNKSLNEEDNRKIAEFLFKYLEENGKKASVLFSFIDFSKLPSEMQRLLLMKNSDELDLHFINPSFMKSTYEISCNLLQKMQNFDSFKEKMNQNNEKLKTEMNQNNEQLKTEMNQNNEQLKTEMNQNNEQLKTEMNQNNEKLKTEMNQNNEKLKTEMNQNNEKLKTEMNQNNEKLKTEMNQNNEKLKTEMNQNNEQLKTEMNQKFEQQNKEAQQLKIEIQSMKERFDKMNASIDKIYPVGSIYMSVKDTNPENIFGGRWERWGKGRVPVGVSESGTFNSVEKTGGSEMHQLTLSEIPSHKGHIPDNIANPIECTYFINYDVGWKNDVISTAYTANKQFVKRSNELTLRSNSEGGGGSHNNLQPYITCFMWKRVS